jgi:hypothetical protein
VVLTSSQATPQQANETTSTYLGIAGATNPSTIASAAAEVKKSYRVRLN